jgi:hypothetical protein
LKVRRFLRIGSLTQNHLLREPVNFFEVDWCRGIVKVSVSVIPAAPQNAAKLSLYGSKTSDWRGQSALELCVANGISD